MAVRIGVLTDTHVPEYLPELPPGVTDALRGVDLIFHCGDVTGAKVLRELGAVAPVYVVAGNHDDPSAGWPQTRVVEVEGYRFGLVHGERSRIRDHYLIAGMNVLWWRWLFLSSGYPDFLVRRFAEPVDVIVSGHIHRPLFTRRGGVWIFSPGAVYMPTHRLLRWARAAGWRPANRDWVQALLARIPTPIPPPAVGLIQVDRAGLRFERIELPDFAHGTNALQPSLSLTGPLAPYSENRFGGRSLSS